MLQPRTFFLRYKIALGIGIILLSLIIIIFGSSAKKHVGPITSTGISFPEPQNMRAFQLETPAHQSFTQKNLEQHWTFLYFGYTHCSDICPTTLAVLNRVYESLHPDHPNLQVVFISIDPARDTANHLQPYLHSFNKNFIALTGSATQLKNVQQQFHIAAEKESNKATADYVIAHTNSIFLINPQGQWTALFPYGVPANKLKLAFEKIALVE